MENLISKLNKDAQIIIKGEEYTVKSKTWYSIEEDETTSYIKCELNNNKVLVIIPYDELIYIGRIIENMRYERMAEDRIKYNDTLFSKTGDGHQFITKIEFGNEDEV